MKVKMLLFLSLFSIICNGQSFDYRKDSLIESFDVKSLKNIIKMVDIISIEKIAFLYISLQNKKNL